MSYETKSIGEDLNSTTLEPLTFGGAPSEDVTAFLGAVKRIAVVQGRQRDDQWIVDYVESCLRGDAMRWFDGIGSGVTQLEWGPLRRLFLQRFNNCNVSTPSAPAPAPAAPPAGPRSPITVVSTRIPDASPLPCVPAAVTVVPGCEHIDKTLIIGDSGVGKTSLLARYSGYGWQPETSATDGVHYQVWLTACGEQGAADHFWDVSGARKYNSIVRTYSLGIQTIWLVYDITNLSSFNSIRSWVQLTGVDISQLAVRLIGTKSDQWDKRVVSEHEGRALAISLRARFYETSAKSNEGIHALRVGWMPALKRSAV